ncbi:hypothetical protein [Nonomuraea polychroma]|uniref:hypothetical protein n=1 Tax=Nonomuraea polychroma TaxID=46176 RepID=UPI0013E2E87C|nr:hypothetical protein [Nonomuraea polychroma]
MRPGDITAKRVRAGRESDTRRLPPVLPQLLFDLLVLLLLREAIGAGADQQLAAVVA